MKRLLGGALIVWPFVGLAWLAGKEFFIATGVTIAIVVSVFYGVYLLIPTEK